jgi:hypothetical protein
MKTGDMLHYWLAGFCQGGAHQLQAMATNGSLLN